MMNGTHNSSGSGGGGNTMGQAMVSVPQRVHSVTQQYLGIMNYLNQSHDIWDQADQKARDHKGAIQLLRYRHVSSVQSLPDGWLHHNLNSRVFLSFLFPVLLSS